MKSNVCDDKALRSCTGCGVCGSVCGKNAITIQLDDEGFYKPVVDEDKCVECNLCKKSCYKYDDNLIQNDEHEVCYAAVNKNNEQLRASSSGGISRVLMEECINRGYKVMGCAYDTKENIAKSIVASSVDELDQFYGSKYFQSLTIEGFDEVLKDKTEQKYAIFGTPCQIYGFSRTGKYQRTPEKYLLVDIFCHGCPSMKLWNSYLTYIEKSTGQNTYDKITFRSKTYAWHEYCHDFFFKSKQYSSKKSKDPFYDIFFGMDVMNEACYDCNSRSSMAYGDIRLGDYWGERYDTNTKGVSAVVLKTVKGVDFFDSVKDKLIIEDTSLSNIFAGQSYGKMHAYNIKRRSFLLESLSGSSDLQHIYETYLRMFPIKVRIKRRLKTIIKNLPKSIYFPLKKLMHSIRQFK